jgi:hypothetical protein
MNQITEYIIVPIGYNSLFLSDQSDESNQTLRFLMFLILFLNRVQSKKHIIIGSLICYLATKDPVIRTMLYCFTYSQNMYESVIIGAGTTLIMQLGMTRDTATVFHIATLFLLKNPPTLNIIDSCLSSHIKSPLPDI